LLDFADQIKVKHLRNMNGESKNASFPAFRVSRNSKFGYICDDCATVAGLFRANIPAACLHLQAWRGNLNKMSASIHRIDWA
tara:strand:- start:1689 stop:1934 length:246 start_codon:yes stop_codon:yes gene_type:complete